MLLLGFRLSRLLHALFVGACDGSASVLVGPELNRPTETGPADSETTLVGIGGGTASVLVAPELNRPIVSGPVEFKHALFVNWDDATTGALGVDPVLVTALIGAWTALLRMNTQSGGFRRARSCT